MSENKDVKIDEHDKDSVFIEKIIQRVPIIESPRVMFTDPYGLTIDWNRNGRTGFHGGVISFSFVANLEPDGTSSQKPGRILMSQIEVLQRRPANLKELFKFLFIGGKADDRPRSVFEGITGLTSMVAVCNRAGELSEHGLTHIVRANDSTRGFFEKLREAGVYAYSNLEGTPVKSPTITKNGTLFACTFPVDKLTSLTKKFVVEGAAIELAEMNDSFIK